MQTSLDLPDLLVRQMQQRASREGREVDEVAADLLRIALSGATAASMADVLPTPLKSPVLEEGDRVRANLEVEREGYHIRRGMEGTVVAVYRGGEAFAVELPGLEEPAAVVTIRPNELERIEDDRGK